VFLGIEDYPRTFAELEARFSSEEACVVFLFILKITAMFWSDNVTGEIFRKRFLFK